MRLHEVNFLCLQIDSPGGTAADCLRLAEFLALDLDPSAVRTVAYIPEQARAQAALVAMACDQIVMRPRAILGGPGSPQMSDDEIRLADRNRSRKTRPEETPLLVALGGHDPAANRRLPLHSRPATSISSATRNSPPSRPNANSKARRPPGLKATASRFPGPTFASTATKRSIIAWPITPRKTSPNSASSTTWKAR